MIELAQKKLLVIAPHPDDEVIGCAGLIQRVKEAEGQVFVLFLTVASTNDFSGRGPSTAEERVNEIEHVAKLLQFDGWRIAFEGDQFHLKLDQVSQKDIIHEIERGEKISLEELKPDIVAFPAFEDYNQDHRAAAGAALAACRPAPPDEKFRPSVILSYEAPMNSWVHPNTSTPINVVIQMSDTMVDQKVKAMSTYASQVRGPGHPRNEAALTALAQLRGSLIGQQFGEGFYCHQIQT